MRAQLVVEVVALQVLLVKLRRERPLEGVAALLRDDVGAEAADLALGRDAAELEADLLNRGVVGGNGGELPAAAAAVAVVHAVVQQLRSSARLP